MHNWLVNALTPSYCILLVYRDPGPHRSKDGRQSKLCQQLSEEVGSSAKHTCFGALPSWGEQGITCSERSSSWEPWGAGGTWTERRWKRWLAKAADYSKYFCPSPHFWSGAGSDHCQLKPSLLEPCTRQDVPSFYLAYLGDERAGQLGVLLRTLRTYSLRSVGTSPSWWIWGCPGRVSAPKLQAV